LPPFPENKPLRLGMSAVVTIDTRDRSGPKLLGSAAAGVFREPSQRRISLPPPTSPPSKP